MPKKVSERIVAALLTMLIGSAFLEEIRLKICSCRIVKCLESKELIEFQSALWYSLTLMEGSIDLLRLVEKDELARHAAAWVHKHAWHVDTWDT